jgi:hypothetical protein
MTILQELARSIVGKIKKDDLLARLSNIKQHDPLSRLTGLSKI